MRSAVFLVDGTNVVFITKVKQHNDLFLFKHQKQKYCFLQTTPPVLYKHKWRYYNCYFVYVKDLNSFDPETREILSDSYEKRYLELLKHHPDRRNFTKLFKSDPPVLPQLTEQATLIPQLVMKHFIIEDNIHATLDELLLRNLLKGINMPGMILLITLLAGMGLGILILVSLGALFPDVVQISVGGAKQAAEGSI
jgi:hypothetical protein